MCPADVYPAAQMAQKDQCGAQSQQQSHPGKTQRIPCGLWPVPSHPTQGLRQTGEPGGGRAGELAAAAPPTSCSHRRVAGQGCGGPGVGLQLSIQAPGCPDLWVFLAEQAWRVGPGQASLTVGMLPSRRAPVDSGGGKHERGRQGIGGAVLLPPPKPQPSLHGAPPSTPLRPPTNAT